MTKALMLVPAASNHAGAFLATALDRRDTVYGKQNAMIFKMAMADEEGKSWSYLPAITPPAGFSRDFYGSLNVAETFMTISHIGRIDGLIMMHAPMIQPWPVDSNLSGVFFFLSEEGQAFWQKVGRAARTQKIVLAGCDSAQSYNQAVANAAGIPAYGFVHSIAAGNPGVTRPYIKTLESGRTPNGMEKSGKSDLSGGVVHPSLYGE
jgi:hypothetical protein